MRQLVRGLNSGRALSRPTSMPVKYAGAPHKAMCLSSDHQQRSGSLGQIDVKLFNVGAVLFNLADYMPPRMEYVQRYDIALDFGFNLSAIEGSGKRATFTHTLESGATGSFTVELDMVHLVTPKNVPDFIRVSPPADKARWFNIDQSTMRRETCAYVFALGDVGNTRNAKTAAKACKRATVVARSTGCQQSALRSGVQRPSIVPADRRTRRDCARGILYAGKVMRTWPSWVIDDERPSRLAWLLKAATPASQVAGTAKWT